MVLSYADSGNCFSALHMPLCLSRGPEDPPSKAEAPFWVFPSDSVYRGCGGASDRRQEVKAGKVTPPTGSPKDTLCLMLAELGCLGEGNPATPRSAGS